MQGQEDISALVGAYPVCGTCAGQNVLRDAWANWNPLTRDWELKTTFEDAWCVDCEGACSLDWRLDTEFRQKRIRRLNDQVRQGDLSNATLVVTRGVQAWGEAFVAAVANAVIAYDRFTEDNDPHGEHDFGAFEVAQRQLFWKIDYFDLALSAHSPDPANRAVTHRVLTIMLACEY